VKEFGAGVPLALAGALWHRDCGVFLPAEASGTARHRFFHKLSEAQGRRGEPIQCGVSARVALQCVLKRERYVGFPGKKGLGSRMRRSDREITERSAIDEIINRCLVCRLGLSDDGMPYVVPLNFGYEDNTLFFHAAPQGRKLDILAKNNRVCFEFDTDVEIVASEDVAGWGTKYSCVIGFGTASLVEDPAEKRRAYDAIMRHYAGKKFTYPDFCVDCSSIIKVTIDSVTGKRSG
jgi:uncharacterized protein